MLLLVSLGIFGVFCKILQLEKFLGTDFKYDNIVFQFQPRNTQVKHFWYQNEGFLVPNLGIFFNEILQLDKLEGADFTYDDSFLKFYIKNT